MTQGFEGGKGREVLPGRRRVGRPSAGPERREQILAAFESRLENDYDEEFENALVEIHKIARMRLVAMGAN